MNRLKRNGLWLLLILYGFYLVGLDKLSTMVFFLLALIGSCFFETQPDGFLQALSLSLSRPQTEGPEGQTFSERWKFRLRFLSGLAGLMIFSLVLILLSGLYIPAHLEFSETVERQLFYIGAAIAVLFFAVFAVRQSEHHKVESSPACLKWFRALRYFALLNFLVYIGYFLSSFEVLAFSSQFRSAAEWLFKLAGLITGILLFELILAMLLKLSQAVQKIDRGCAVNPPVLIELFGSEPTIAESMAGYIKSATGVDASRSHVVRYFTGIFEPVCIFAVIILWLLTAVIIVEPGKEVVFIRAGRIVDFSSFGPGIYLKLPWPFTIAQIHDSMRVKDLNIGFEPDPQQRHMIWTRSHTLKTFDLIVGDGVEMISIDCQILYRVDNLVNYLTGFQNPEELITATAYKLLTQETVSESFDGIITTDREQLSARIEKKLQAALDEAGSGVKVVEVVFLAIHPPLQIADAFEEVISAQIDKLTFVLQANTTNLNRTLMTRALAKGQELEAESYSLRLVSEAIGEAEAFSSRSNAHLLDPGLSRFRSVLETFEKVVSHRKVFVIDQSLGRSQDRLVFDLGRN